MPPPSLLQAVSAHAATNAGPSRTVESFISDTTIHRPIPFTKTRERIFAAVAGFIAGSAAGSGDQLSQGWIAMDLYPVTFVAVQSGPSRSNLCRKVGVVASLQTVHAR